MENMTRQKLVNSVDNSERQRLASQYRAKLHTQVRELYKTHGIKQVASILGVSVWIVTQTIKEFSIPTRKRGQDPDGHHYGNSGEQPDRKGYGQKNGTTRSRATYVEAYGKLPSNWDVHHIDCNKTNNDLDNLVALPRGEHARLHCYARHGNEEGVTTILREYLQVKGNASNPSYGL